MYILHTIFFYFAYFQIHYVYFEPNFLLNTQSLDYVLWNKYVLVCK